MTLSTNVQYNVQSLLQSSQSQPQPPQRIHGQFIILSRPDIESGSVEQLLPLVLESLAQANFPSENPVIKQNQNSVFDITLGNGQTVKLRFQNQGGRHIHLTRQSVVFPERRQNLLSCCFGFRRRGFQHSPIDETIPRSQSVQLTPAILQLNTTDWHFLFKEKSFPAQRLLLQYGIMKAGSTFNQWKYVRELGVGAFARVHLYHHPNDRRRTAVIKSPRLSKTGIDGVSTEKMLVREALLLANLDHPHIVKCLGGAISEGKFHLIMERAIGQELYDLIEAKKKQLTIRSCVR